LPRSGAAGFGAVPSLPAESTTTAFVGPGIVLFQTPARKAALWLAALPIRIVPDSPATPGFATSMLREPVVRLMPALEPIAMFRDPVAW
jgi:hypothetical protein